MPLYRQRRKSRRVNQHTQATQLVSGTPWLELRVWLQSHLCFELSSQADSEFHMDVLFTSPSQIIMGAKHMGEAQQVFGKWMIELKPWTLLGCENRKGRFKAEGQAEWICCVFCRCSLEGWSVWGTRQNGGGVGCHSCGIKWKRLCLVRECSLLQNEEMLLLKVGNPVGHLYHFLFCKIFSFENSSP